MTASDDYPSFVSAAEQHLAQYAKRSFEPWSQQFVDGGELLSYYTARWASNGGRDSLANRTPLQLERDRILYSPALRKQAEKYHVLYSGQRRIVRNFATHTMRAAQVSRAIARGLRLNEDFAEAIALGSKVGATPFVHAAKDAINTWLYDTIHAIDTRYVEGGDRRDRGSKLFDEDKPLPAWVQRIESAATFDAVRRHMPWGAGIGVERAYSSGQQSYWVLCTNPFTLEARPQQFMPESMFGVWRHSRDLEHGGVVFHHRIAMDKATNDVLEITGEHATFESRVVQYADDITWAIENLHDANSAALLNQRPSIYEQLRRELRDTGIEALPGRLHDAISENDSGGLYTYFIADLVENSRKILDAVGDGVEHDARTALRSSSPEATLRLSQDGERYLTEIIAFLNRVAFDEPRVRNRKDMLKEVSRQCVRLLYEGDADALPRYIRDRAALELWTGSRTNRALELLDNDVHRAQIAVSVFADMADQEIYDFVGIQSL